MTGGVYSMFGVDKVLKEKCLWLVWDKIVLVALDVGFPQVLRCVIYFLEHIIFLQRRNRL